MKQITWTWKLPVWHMPFFPLLNSQNEHSAYFCHGRYLPWYPGWQCPKTYILVAPTFRTVRTMKASLLFTSDARYKYILLIARVVLNILPFHPNSSSKEFIHRYALSLSLSPSLPSAQRWRSWVKQHRKGHTNFAPAYNIPPRGESKFMHNFIQIYALLPPLLYTAHNNEDGKLRQSHSKGHTKDFSFQPQILIRGARTHLCPLRTTMKIVSYAMS